MIVLGLCREIPQDLLNFYEKTGIEEIYLSNSYDDETDKFIIAMKAGTHSYIGYIDELGQKYYYYYEKTLLEKEMLRLIKLKAFL